MKNTLTLCLLITFLFVSQLRAQLIAVNQIGYEQLGEKKAVATFNKPISSLSFDVFNATTHKKVYGGKAITSAAFKSWGEKDYFKIDFSGLSVPGKYYIKMDSAVSPYFEIGSKLLAKQTLPALLHYFRNQRANTKIELENDQNVKLFGSDKTVDLQGGWCDASGDVSKYFSHLAYANFMSPQQIPLVTWSLLSASEKMPKLLKQLNLTDSVADEARYGADYLMKSLSDEGYFYMIVFSYFNKDPKARRVVGLHANSVTTNEFQCAFREGGGMAIASLARISRWPTTSGKYTPKVYLAAAKRAYAHLKQNNLKYCDDGKENIIDDYCALMAATELYKATDSAYYLDEARQRVKQLSKRLSPAGYFIANDTDRPYYHASDAGLPLVSLQRYLEVEKTASFSAMATNVIKRNLNYQLSVTAEVENPFGYARQTIRLAPNTVNSFFIPHENETGWWWQGENARLASLATAGLLGVKGENNRYKKFASDQMNWILGLNPFQVCFMYGFGINNVPYMASNYGHGSQRGGISNGITGAENLPDGQGIAFKEEAKGNEWRWTEQWLPHAAWFLQAITALEKEE